jgi:hypothetical protein
MVVWPMRVATAFASAVLLTFVCYYAGGAYAHYWVWRDGTVGVASITDKGQHGTRYYVYTANNVVYSGHSQPNRSIGVGERVTVWHSATHPWLSSLSRPAIGIDLALLPLMMIFLAVAIGLAKLSIAPRHKLASCRSRHHGIHG